MKKGVIILLVSACCISANSTNLIPLLTSSAKWSVVTTDESFTPEHMYTTQYTIWYKISGESTVNDKTYKEMVSTTDSTTIAWKKSFLIRENEGKVYWLLNEFAQEELLYDFTLNVNESIIDINPARTKVSKVISINDTTMNGIVRKKMVLTNYNLDYPEMFYTETWIEGIGSLLGLKRESCDFAVGCYKSHKLCCYYSNNDLTYQCPTCSCDIGSFDKHIVSSELELIKNCTNPFNDVLYLKLNKITCANIELYNSAGLTIFSDIINNTSSKKIQTSSFSPGIYILIIRDNERVISVKKLIKL